MAGLYQLHQLRQLGLKVRAFDTAGDVGAPGPGTAIPAPSSTPRLTSISICSEDLYKNWSWSARFPGQPEIERWLGYIADSLDLRRDISFSTTITSAVFDEDRTAGPSPPTRARFMTPGSW